MVFAITEPKEKQAGVFYCDDDENFYLLIRSLEEIFRVAVEHGKALKVIAVFLPKTS